jgi:hypothetical protein
MHSTVYCSQGELPSVVHLVMTVYPCCDLNWFSAGAGTSRNGSVPQTHGRQHFAVAAIAVFHADNLYSKYMVVGTLLC